MSWNFPRLRWAGGGLLAAGIFLAVVGCEDLRIEPAQEGPDISPQEVTVNKGQSVTFTASNGYDYEWRLDHEDWGTLSARTGPQTVYRSLREPASADTVEVQTLRLRSTIPGSSGTNGEAYVREAEAYIKHVRVKVSPSTISAIYFGQSVVLRASGGSSYTWSLQTPAWGRLSTTTGPTTTYTSWYTPATNETAIQVVTVRSYESEATASITHR